MHPWPSSRCTLNTSTHSPCKTSYEPCVTRPPCQRFDQWQELRVPWLWSLNLVSRVRNQTAYCVFGVVSNHSRLSPLRILMEHVKLVHHLYVTRDWSIWWVDQCMTPDDTHGCGFLGCWTRCQPPSQWWLQTSATLVCPWLCLCGSLWDCSQPVGSCVFVQKSNEFFFLLGEKKKKSQTLKSQKKKISCESFFFCFAF